MADDTLQDLYRKNQAVLTRIQKECEEEIVRIYSEALDEIRKELRALYRKYQEDGALSNADKTVYNRLKQLESQIKDLLNRKNEEVGELLERLVSDQFEESFYRMAYSFDAAGRIELQWGLIPEAAVEELIRSPLDKLFQSEAVKAAGEGAFERIRKDLELALVRGDSFQTLSRRIAKALGIDKTGNGYAYGRRGLAAKAMTIARTEGMRALNMGHRRAYDEAREMGCDLIEMWDATLDSRTRPSHGALDGQYRDEENGGWFVPELGRYVPGPGQSGVASFDINCRCRTTAHVKGFPPTGRYVRGKGTDEPYITYSEWKRRLEEQALNGALPITTEKGHVVRGLSMHLLKRSNERAVAAADIIDALLHPIHTEERGPNAAGQPGFRYIGRNATVGLNPESGRITTAWKTGERARRKYGSSK